VKGGENVSAPVVRDLRGVVEREKADAGLFITLTEPTRRMRRKPTRLDYLKVPLAASVTPRLQITSDAGGSRQGWII
jgi:site-specific DNA-methyltransferase (adenine-specific)